MADVWAVAAAGAKEAPAESGFAAASRVAVTAGPAPSRTPDGVEQVPDVASAPGGAAEKAAGKAPAKVVQRGNGRFTVVAVPASALRPSPARGRTVRWTVESEGGLGVDTAGLATTVATVLGDARGWQTKDRVRFVNVSPAQAGKGAVVDLRITLASPDTTDRLCAPLQTRGQVSCHNSGRVVLNARRWLLGAEAYGADVAAYRTYLVNHEVGHGLGHGHAYCGGSGKVAPVMMQQTYGLKGCTAWPWPTAKTRLTSCGDTRPATEVEKRRCDGTARIGT